MSIDLRHVLRVGGGLFRGAVASRAFTRTGKGLRVYGEVSVLLRHGTIEIGDQVSLENTKIVVAGTPQRQAELVIGDLTMVNDRSEIHAGISVRIGARCAIAGHVRILDRDYHRIGDDDGSVRALEEKLAPVTLEDRVWVGMGATILKGVVVGEGAVVAAGAVVTRSVPPATLVAGNPARVVRERIRWEL